MKRGLRARGAGARAGARAGGAGSANTVSRNWLEGFGGGLGAGGGEANARAVPGRFRARRHSDRSADPTTTKPRLVTGARWSGAGRHLSLLAPLALGWLQPELLDEGSAGLAILETHPRHVALQRGG